MDADSIDKGQEEQFYAFCLSLKYGWGNTQEENVYQHKTLI